MEGQDRKMAPAEESASKMMEAPTPPAPGVAQPIERVSIRLATNGGAVVEVGRRSAPSADGGMPPYQPDQVSAFGSVDEAMAFVHAQLGGGEPA